MGRYLSDIRSSVRDIMRDEFTEGVTPDFETDELDRLIAITLAEMEQKMPYELRVKAYDALSTVATELSATATTLVVASDDDFSTTYSFYITIEDEVLQVTALASADNFTVGRAKLGTTAAVHAVGKDVGLTILTAANSKEIDISNIKDLIRVRTNRGVEYKTGQNTKQFRNHSRFADVLTMDIAFLPSANETVWLYCLKKHTLTDNTSTLRSEHETILIQGVAARAARNKGREQLNSLNVGGVNVGTRMISVGELWRLEYKAALKSQALKDHYEALPKD